MNGMDASTGKPLSDTEHLAQSLKDILTTPLGSRAMRRDYGSLLFELLDQPINGALRLLLQAATAIAIRRWEPRLKLTKVKLEGAPASGQLTMRITGQRTDGPTANAYVSLSIPLRQGATAPAAS